MTSASTQFRQLLQQESLILAPGAFDGLSARLVEQAGFSAIYASGGAIARSRGVPDIGLLTLTEVAQRLEQMVEVTTIPIIADADTGFGNTLNVRRTVQILEAIGVAAIHLEDQEFPKRCGHLSGKTLISQADMCDKIRVAKDAQAHDDFYIIARTDAIAVEGFERALERAHAYMEAGADMMFVEAPESLEQITAIAGAISEPKLINMFYGGKTPLVERQQLQELGYKLVIIPSDLQRAAIFGMQQTLNSISEHGDSASMSSQLVTFQQREDIIGTQNYLEKVKKGS